MKIIALQGKTVKPVFTYKNSRGIDNRTRVLYNKDASVLEQVFGYLI